MTRGTTVPRALTLPLALLHHQYVLEQRAWRHGSWTTVFRGWDCQRGQVVAIKRAHGQPACVAALRREAQVLSLLNHPMIPACFETCEEEGHTYLVEEWRSGVPLSKQDLSVEQVRLLGQALTMAVSTLHTLEIFHGDLSPAHVLLEGTRVSLLGLGWAATRVAPHRVQGTEGYASPEQWNRGLVTVRGAVYSLAMVLGCALTKCSPSEVQRASSFSGLWDAHSSWTIPPDLVDLLALLDRAIAPEPTARPALAAVQAAFAGEQGTR